LSYELKIDIGRISWKINVVKGVNNGDNWGSGQERGTFPDMVGCLVVG
jgi:hypothetical protein